MYNIKKLVFLKTVLLGLIFFSISGFSACIVEPSYIEISSGSNNLGQFNAADSVYIKPDLNDDALRIDFFFENSQENCYESNGVEVQLFPSGNFVKGSLSTQSSSAGYLSKASFVFNPQIKIASAIISNFKTTSNDGNVGTGSLVFNIDSTKPFLEISGVRNNTLVKGGDSIDFKYYVEDTGSRLSSLRISGGDTFVKIYDDGESSESGTYTDTPSSSRTYSFLVDDRLGNTESQMINVIVDSSAPTLDNLMGVYDYSNGVRGVTYTIDVKDESFKSGNNMFPTINGDFSKLNSGVNSISASCNRVDDETFNCRFPRVAIGLDETSNVQLIFSVSDSIGNSAEITKTDQVFIDKKKPTIKEFYVKNRLGVKGVFSIFDENVTVVLVAEDESFDHNTYRLNAEFGMLQFEPNSGCSVNGKTLTCEWELKNKVEIYSGLNEFNDNYTISVYDKYSNVAERNIVVAVDNLAPKISEIELIETESIKDNILKSKEIIDFEILITDSNLRSDDTHFIYGDFIGVSFDQNQDMKTNKASCNQYNSTTLRCNFYDIKVGNGHFKRNITFTIADLAGNGFEKEYEIEVFKIGDESVSTYTIGDLSILNPINRNQIKREGVKVWFEGFLRTEDESMVLVNYQIAGCNESELDPILVIPGTVELFPEEVVVSRDGEDISDFALSFELKDYPIMEHLNNKNMSCEISVLKRDAETVYPPELVKMNLILGFYDMPRGDLLNAHALDILEDIEDVEFLGGWFDDIFKIYNTFSTVCSTVSSLLGVVSTVDLAWTPIGTVLSKIIPTIPLELAVTTGVDGIDSVVSMLRAASKPITTFCDYVTCKKTPIVGGLLKDSAFGKKMAETMKSLKENTPINSDICGALDAGAKGAKKLEETKGAVKDGDKGKTGEEVKETGSNDGGTKVT